MSSTPDFVKPMIDLSLFSPGMSSIALVEFQSLLPAKLTLFLYFPMPPSLTPMLKIL